jgi:hypothetical protein
MKLKAWLKQTAVPLLIAMAPAMGIGFLVGSVPGYKTYEYTWKNAQFCTACHVHDYASVGWSHSSHGQMTTCHDCHHQPLHQYPKELWVLIKDNPKFPKDLHHTPYIPRDLCESCHLSKGGDPSSITGPLSREQIKRLPKVDQLKLHAFHLKQKVRMPLPSELHVEDTKEFGKFLNTKILPEKPGQGSAPLRPITCMDCHGGPPNRAHQFTATDRSCVQCHQPLHHNSLIRQVGCRSCHFQEFMTPIKK